MCTSDIHSERLGRLSNRLRNGGDRCLVKNHFDAVRNRLDRVEITNVSLDEFDSTFEIGEIGTFPCCQIIKRPDGLTAGE